MRKHNYKEFLAFSEYDGHSLIESQKQRITNQFILHPTCAMMGA